MQYYTPEQLPGSSKRGYTPEGYLVCRDTPIARTGEQEYGENEVKDGGSRTRVVRVDRLPEHVFHPDTMASFEGKDVLLDHPEDGHLVGPKSWRDHTRGSVQNVRRSGNLVLADLIVKDPDAIRAIEDGSQDQVSAGYDAEYVEDGPGVYHQENIVGNHVALVKRGRCGEECRVLDHARSEDMPTLMTTTMDRAVPVRGRVRRFMDRAIKAISTGDADEMRRLREEADELPDELREEARTERHEIPHEEMHGREAEDETHFHVHMPGRDQEMEHMENEAGEGGEHVEPDGDEPATKADIAVILNLIKELLDADDEGDDLAEEEANGGEVADRRIRVHDRRRRARDALRMHAKRVHDEVGEIAELKPDKESTGRSNLPGTEGANHSTEVDSLSVHDRARRRATGDRATQDSAGLKDTWDLVMSRAEILCPGASLTEGGRIVTFDAAVSALTTDLRLCALRRRTLDAAYRTPEGREIIDAVTEGSTFNLSRAPCAAVEPIFNAASAMRAERNRRSYSAPVARTTGDAARAAALGIAATPAEMNAANREKFKPRAAR